MTDLSTVERVIRRWWAAMEGQDLGTLRGIVDRRCTFVGGPDGREVGRDQFLVTARGFFARSTIIDWQIERLQIEVHGDTAVATYAWSETGTQGDQSFSIEGIATDIHRRAEDEWRMIARHAGMGRL
jgi:ketosteroid isomerase-like protein